MATSSTKSRRSSNSRAAAPAKESAPAKPARRKVGDLVDYETIDPITGDPITGRGLVVDAPGPDDDGEDPGVLVAPLSPLGIRVPHEQAKPAG